MSTRFTRRLALLFALLCCHNLHASSDEPSSAIEQAIDARLWLHPEWLDLIHYSVETDAYRSHADDDRFFLADEGKTDPRAELEATLHALYAERAAPDQHARCRFPARERWLSAQLGFDRAALPSADCPGWEEWSSIVKAGHVTMVFPAYHLNSPSSMYGHTLLRIDPGPPGDDQAWSKWLSYAVNFGADIQVDDNSLFYAFKGLTGGYPGLFITTPYYNKIREYNRDENRDIWEYELNLDAIETERLVTHLWELKEINFDYYFFDENCSYRLLELLEVARPSVEITDEYVMTAIPVDTVRTIQRADMVAAIRYRPSMVTALRYRIEQIPVEHHELILAITGDPALLESDRFTALDDASKAIIADTAYRYHRYLHRDSSEDNQASSRNFRLLKAVRQYSDALPESIDVPPPVPPDQSHHSKRVAISAGERADEGYAELSLKLSFHDLEDRLSGFLQGAEINMGRIAVRHEDDATRLESLNIIEIFSLTPRDRFFDPLSWRIRFGFERQFTAGERTLVAEVDGGAGVSYALFDDSMVYLLGIARLEHNREFDDSLEFAAGLHTGLLMHFDGHTAHIEATGEEFGNDVYRVKARYTHNFALARNHSIKLTASREWQSDFRYNDIGLSYQYYFE